MIYGNRFYAFETKPVTEATIEEVSAKQPQITFESVIDSFGTVYELSKITENSELLDSYLELLEKFVVDDEIVEEGVKDTVDKVKQGAKDLAKSATGANIEYTKKFKEHYKEYCNNYKAGRDACKKKNGRDYAKAQKLYLKAADNAKAIIKDFDSVKSDTMSSALLGDFIGGAINFMILAINTAAAAIPGTGYGLSVALNITHIIGMATEQVNAYKNDLYKIKDSIDPKDTYKTWNLYKNKLETGAKFLLDCAQNCANQCGRWDKELKAKEKDNK